MKKLLLILCLVMVPLHAFGEETEANGDKEYQELLTKSPFNKLYPKQLAPAAADYFGQWNKALFKEGPIASKEARLVAVSASVAMKCEYCIKAQVVLAKQAGASDDEIKAAIQIAAEVARFSMLLYGNEFSHEELDKILEKMTQAPKK